jgi:hypothetical protein
MTYTPPRAYGTILRFGPSEVLERSPWARHIKLRAAAIPVQQRVARGIGWKHSLLGAHHDDKTQSPSAGSRHGRCTQPVAVSDVIPNTSMIILLGTWEFFDPVFHRSV